MSQDEINKAIAILDKAEKEKIKKQQRQNFTQFYNYSMDKNI